MIGTELNLRLKAEPDAINLDFLKRWLGLTELTGNQWLIALGVTLALVLIDEIVKIFMRGRSDMVDTLPPMQPAVAARPQPPARSPS